jgi:nucleotide-binding universal stress UspA family protein
MDRLMKIMFAYDGSSSAEVAIDDLRRAGLPREALVMVVSVIEQWMPVPKSYGGVDIQFAESSPAPAEKAEILLNQARSLIHSSFPNWKVVTEAEIGSPARVVLQKADEWKPNLIVVGSSGHSALGRWLLGSVSQKVLTEANCSVRVARPIPGRAGKPLRIAIGVDGSPGAALAVNEVLSRSWPAGTEVKLITADFAVPHVTSSHLVGPITKWIQEERERIGKEVEAAAGALASKGVDVYRFIKEGDPKSILGDEVERWGADCLFVGAKKLHAIDRFLLGSVSAAMATRINCSVEVVRANPAS